MPKTEDQALAEARKAIAHHRDMHRQLTATARQFDRVAEKLPRGEL